MRCAGCGEGLPPELMPPQRAAHPVRAGAGGGPREREAAVRGDAEEGSRGDDAGLRAPNGEARIELALMHSPS